jgi:hypothetical protein
VAGIIVPGGKEIVLRQPLDQLQNALIGEAELPVMREPMDRDGVLRMQASPPQTFGVLCTQLCFLVVSVAMIRTSFAEIISRRAQTK